MWLFAVGPDVTDFAAAARAAVRDFLAENSDE
jgi:hypothetical protein